VEAASVPIGALTAWQGLFDRAKLQVEERVLVHGGAGAVGIFAIQLARFHGAYVTATASVRNLEFVTGLGAEQVIDYQTIPFDQTVGEMDVVFDTVGGETLQRSWSVLKPGRKNDHDRRGQWANADDRVKLALFIVEPNQKQFIWIGNLLESGELQPMVDTVLQLAQASAAYTGEIRERRGARKAGCYGRTCYLRWGD
jgi:NADPH:quinone reductase-like Zn-dependent oxidoreductase